MKKITLTLAIVALSFSNCYATEAKFASENIEIVTDLTKDQIEEVYDWNVKTNQGNYSGTSKSLEEAQKMIDLASAGEIILDRKIESFFQVKEIATSGNRRLYFWEVTTNFGSAKGFSDSESQAKKMIELVSVGDILTYKIVLSGDYQK